MKNIRTTSELSPGKTTDLVYEKYIYVFVGINFFNFNCDRCFTETYNLILVALTIVILITYKPMC